MNGRRPRVNAPFGIAALATRKAYFIAENEVGLRKTLSILARIDPFLLLLSRAAIHFGSASNSVHFRSRSASDCQAMQQCKSLLPSPTKTVQKPTCLMPCLSQIFRTWVSNKWSKAGNRPGLQLKCAPRRS